MTILLYFFFLPFIGNNILVLLCVAVGIGSAASNTHSLKFLNKYDIKLASKFLCVNTITQLKHVDFVAGLALMGTLIVLSIASCVIQVDSILTNLDSHAVHWI